MNNQKIAQELVAVARELSAGTWALPKDQRDVVKIVKMINRMRAGSAPLPNKPDPSDALYGLLGDDDLFIHVELAVAALDELLDAGKLEGVRKGRLLDARLDSQRRDLLGARLLCQRILDAKDEARLAKPPVVGDRSPDGDGRIAGALLRRRRLDDRDPRRLIEDRADAIAARRAVHEMAGGDRHR